MFDAPPLDPLRFEAPPALLSFEARPAEMPEGWGEIASSDGGARS